MNQPSSLRIGFAGFRAGLSEGRIRTAPLIPDEDLRPEQPATANATARPARNHTQHLHFINLPLAIGYRGLQRS
jgi:hypothetical protein